MVTIIDFKSVQNTDGKDFFLLVLQGGIEFLRSTITNKFYATARKVYITCTFDEATCKQLIGTKVPGCIQKVEVDPYEYKIAQTGEMVMLTHSYIFNPEPNSVEETVFQPEMMNA
jgi:hypothetical protein